MLKIFKHLRNSSFIIFIIILLLAGQASCELSLPTYTSNIINIGIQQRDRQSTRLNSSP